MIYDIHCKNYDVGDRMLVKNYDVGDRMLVRDPRRLENVRMFVVKYKSYL